MSSFVNSAHLRAISQAVQDEIYKWLSCIADKIDPQWEEIVLEYRGRNKPEVFRNYVRLMKVPIKAYVKKVDGSEVDIRKLVSEIEDEMLAIAAVVAELDPSGSRWVFKQGLDMCRVPTFVAWKRDLPIGEHRNSWGDWSDRHRDSRGGTLRNMRHPVRVALNAALHDHVSKALEALDPNWHRLYVRFCPEHEQFRGHWQFVRGLKNSDRLSLRPMFAWVHGPKFGSVDCTKVISLCIPASLLLISHAVCHHGAASHRLRVDNPHHVYKIIPGVTFIFYRHREWIVVEGDENAFTMWTFVDGKVVQRKSSLKQVLSFAPNWLDWFSYLPRLMDRGSNDYVETFTHGGEQMGFRRMKMRLPAWGDIVKS